MLTAKHIFAAFMRVNPLTAVLLLSCMSATPSFALTPISLNPMVMELALDKHIDYLIDESKSLSIEEILANSTPLSWQKVQQNNASFGFTDKPIWVHFQLYNPGSHTFRYLEIDNPVLDYIDIYVVLDGKIGKSHKLGDKYPFYQRLIHHRNFIVPLDFEDNQMIDIYTRVKSSSAIQLPLHLRTRDNLLTNTQSTALILGLYNGFIILMVLYNLFIYISIRDINYLYYIGFSISLVLFLATLNGVGFQHVWPDFVRWNDFNVIFCLAGLTVFGALLTKRLLVIDKHSTVMSFLFDSLTFLGLISALLAFFVPYQIMLKAVIFICLCTTTLTVAASLQRIREGYEPAIYCLLASACLLFSGTALALNKASFLPQYDFSDKVMLICANIVVIFLSMALAAKISKEKKEHHGVQQQALEHERQVRISQEQLLEVQKKANASLAQCVEERTEELRTANQKLKELSTTDGLTGLKNKRFFDDRFNFEFARATRDKTSVALLLLDIDHFKQFNDCHGHLEGDDCLKIIAKNIQEQVRREIDMVARYGGEEFIVLLPSTSTISAMQLAEKIRESIENLSFIVGQQIEQVTISIGVTASSPTFGDSSSGLLAEVHKGLYEAKSGGRNRVSCADEISLASST